MGRKKLEGRTPPVQFRLEEEILAALDAISREIGGTRTEAVRALARAGLKTPSMVPHYGEVPCGPGEVLMDEPAPDMIDPFAAFKRPGLFLLTAKGRSLESQGVFSGDRLFIRRADAAEHGQTAVATVDGAVTLKKLEMRRDGPPGAKGRAKEELWLTGDGFNRKVDDGVRILGVLVGVVRKC